MTGVTEELTKLAEAAQAQECLRTKWARSTDDAERASIIRTAIPHVERQLELAHARQRNLDEFEDELTAKLALMRRRLAELESGGDDGGR